MPTKVRVRKWEETQSLVSGQAFSNGDENFLTSILRVLY